MTIVCCKNEVLCPYCGKKFKSIKLKSLTIEDNFIDYTTFASYKEKCHSCKKLLTITFERQDWFTAEECECNKI